MFSLNKEFLLSQSVSIEMSGSLRKLGEYQGIVVPVSSATVKVTQRHCSDSEYGVFE